MASVSVTVGARVRGLWRIRLAAWILRGLRIEYRIDAAPWRDLPLAVDITLRPSEDGSR